MHYVTLRCFLRMTKHPPTLKGSGDVAPDNVRKWGYKKPLHPSDTPQERISCTQTAHMSETSNNHQLKTTNYKLHANTLLL
jgi:hypothetical protein